MADVFIDTSVDSGSGYAPLWSVVSVSPSVIYAVFDNSNGDIAYSKSTDSGATWSAANQLKASAGNLRFAMWYDRWTPGDLGTKIHLWFTQETNALVTYMTLDTSNDAESAPVTVFTGVSFSGGATSFSGCKSRGGNLYIWFDGDGGTETGFYRSTDNGANWTARATLSGGGDDKIIVLPGNAADTNDLVVLFMDLSDGQLQLKEYDDSANSVATTVIEANSNSNTYKPQVAAAVRPSDGHVIAAALQDADSATCKLRVFDINGSSSITLMSIPLENVDNVVACNISLNYNTDDIYLFYLGNEDESESPGLDINVYYKKSTDGGATWGSQVQYTENGGNNRSLFAQAGTAYGRLFAVVAGDSLLITNATQSIEVSTSGSATITGSGSLVATVTPEVKLTRGDPRFIVPAGRRLIY